LLFGEPEEGFREAAGEVRLSVETPEHWPATFRRDLSMRKKHLSGLLLVAALGVSACGAEDFASPTSPSTSAATSSSGGGSTTSSCGGRYAGPGSSTVYSLLGWVSYSLACTGSGTPPNGSNWNQIMNGSCIRDQYVAAAITNAWGAAAYAYQGKTSQAQQTAAAMCNELRNADQLCSNAPTFAGARSCITEQIYACGPNGSPGFATTRGCS
jgi:hypothetical protein